MFTPTNTEPGLTDDDGAFDLDVSSSGLLVRRRFDRLFGIMPHFSFRTMRLRSSAAMRAIAVFHKIPESLEKADEPSRQPLSFDERLQRTGRIRYH